VRLAINLFEDVEPLVFLFHDAAQPRLHERVPDSGVVVIREALGLHDRLLHDGPELRILLLVGARRTDQQHDARHCQ